MVSREEFETIIEELSKEFANEFGDAFKGVVITDSSKSKKHDPTDSLVFVRNQKIVVNYSEWTRRYPFMDENGFRDYLRESIRNEIVNNAK